MEYLKTFENHQKTYTGEEVSEYFKSMGEGHSWDDKHHMKNMYNRIHSFDYTLENISISNMLKVDTSLNEFIESIGEKDDDFIEYSMGDCYDCPIIIAEWSEQEGKCVIDGYHRIAEHIRRGEDMIKAYVYIK